MDHVADLRLDRDVDRFELARHAHHFFDAGVDVAHREVTPDGFDIGLTFVGPLLHDVIVGLGTAVVVAPLYTPARLLAEIGMVDVLSNGRLDVGIGMGYQRYEARTPRK